MAVEDLVEAASRDSRCRVHPSVGIPNVATGLSMPEDLSIFYHNCGGIDMFLDRDYGISIVSPDDFVPSNPVIVGEQVPDDITATWYIIARTPNGEHLSIDLSPDRSGKCYDSFYEVHGIVGECPVIATSFSGLLESLLNAEGGYWFWLSTDFAELGDAYD